jgi:hypothetical protein
MNYCLEAEKGLTTVTEQRDRMEEKLRIELRGHPDSELWGDAGLIAATMRCVDALDEVTEQRDEAREALKTGGMLNIIDRTHHERAAAIRERDEARHSLTTVTEQRDRLAEAIRLTLINNLDLCDGDICTLKRLKDAFGFDLDSLENVPVRPPARKESL